jgi:predicted nucleic acid-binding protein
MFVDTSAWYALTDERDPNHEDALALVADARAPLITTNWVVGETLNLTRSRMGHRVAVALGAELRTRAGIRLIRVSKKDEEEAWRLFQRYADKDFSFTDCTSFAVMRRLHISHALAFDRHFQQMGFRVN